MTDNVTGKRIKTLRKQKKITQEALGEIVGVQKSAIAKYERGEIINLKRETIAKLASYFGVRPSYLMGMDDDTTQLIITDKTEIQLVENYRIAPLPTQSAINLLLDIKEDDE